MSEVLQIKQSESLIDSKWTKPKNWILSLLTGDLPKYRLSRNLKRVEYWWIEINTNDYKVNRKIGFDILKSPIVGLSDIELQIDFKNMESRHEIDSVLFKDIWSIYDKRDFKKLTEIHSRYLEFWCNSKKIDTPRFPCILIDFNNIAEVSKIITVEQLLNQPDFIGYEWSDSERLIDSIGNVYKTEYYNFGHPFGVVIPSTIERRLKNTELIDILKNKKIDFKIAN